jgi:hypothetical protein
MEPAVTKFYDYGTHKEFFDARFGPNCIDEMAETEGTIPHYSRLLGALHLQSSKLPAALQSALTQVPQGQLRGHLVAGGAVMNPSDATFVNPAWRSAYVHLIGTVIGEIGTDAGEFNVNSLTLVCRPCQYSFASGSFKSSFERSLTFILQAPEMGAYANEVCIPSRFVEAVLTD